MILSEFKQGRWLNGHQYAFEGLESKYEGF